MVFFSKLILSYTKSFIKQYCEGKRKLDFTQVEFYKLHI